MMSEDALGTQVAGGISSRRVGPSRMMLGWVGVESGVKDRGQIGGFQYQGYRQRHDGRHGIARRVRPLVGCHVLLLSSFGVASHEGTDRAVAEEDGHQVIIGLAEELARRSNDVRFGPTAIISASTPPPNPRPRVASITP